MITIGLSTKDFLSTKQPGTDGNSYGYYGVNGKKYSSSKHGKEYGPEFKEGDIVGCGIHYYKKEIFFTKNGKYLGFAFPYKDDKKLYPTIGLNSPGERITANFGNKLFKFDIKSFIEVNLKIYDNMI